MRRIWERFWFAEVDGRPLGAVRIGIAISGIVFWAGALPLVRQFYSDLGEFPIDAARGWSRELFARYLLFDGLGSYPAVVIIFLLWGVALAALLVGWRTRVAAWAHLVLYLWVFYRNTTFGNGGDEVLRLMSLYLAIAYTFLPVPARAFTLDRWRWARAAGENSVPTIPAWPIRMVQIQICVVYLVAGFWKLVDPLWWNGVALIYALGNESFTRFGAPTWGAGRPLYAAVTIAVGWWEFLFPALVAGGRTRAAALWAGVALHLGIFVFMSIGIFPIVMLACYPAFVRGESIGRAVASIRKVISRPGQASSSSTASTADRVSSKVSA